MTDAPWRHRVTYAIGNREGWRFFPEINAYDVACDILTPSDGVTLTVPWSSDVWRLIGGDNQVNIWIGNQRVFSGIIDGRDRNLSREGATATFTARDKVGRLLDESAPLIRLEGLGIVDLGVKLFGSLLKIDTSNASNRRLITGPAGKTAAREPAIDRGPQAKRKVEPGETKWAVFSHFLEEGRLLAWATADGSSLVVGRPNYQQKPQWSFVIDGWPGDGSVIDYVRRESQADRFSRIDVLVGRFSRKNGNLISQRGVARNGPADDGTGVDFRFPKRLIVKDDRVREATPDARAAREMAERDAGKDEILLTTWGHGQVRRGGAAAALYAFDTVADVDDREIPERGSWYLTSVRYTGDKESGQRTSLRMVPIGTDLRMAGG
jgi:prophage tail gpP-like protein